MAFCTTCGRPVADGVINCGICDPQQQVIVAPGGPRTSPLTWFLVPLVAGFAIWMIALIVRHDERAQEDPCRSATAVLSGWERGATLPAMWAGRPEPTMPVASFTTIGHVGGGDDRDTCLYHVRLKTRFRIVGQDWSFEVQRRPDASKYDPTDRWLVVLDY